LRLRFPTFNVDGLLLAIFANSGLFGREKKLRDYAKSEWDKFLYADDSEVKVKSLGNLKRPSKDSFKFKGSLSAKMRSK
jgi:hypothetical protein